MWNFRDRGPWDKPILPHQAAYNALIFPTLSTAYRPAFRARFK